MQSQYAVPTIPQNLRRDETIVQIAEALTYLSDVSDDIFTRVNNRVSSNRIQLESLSNRVNIAGEKIKQISGAKHAIQVFSSSRYPSVDSNRPYESLFSTQQSLQLETFDYKYKNVSSVDEPLEKLQFYHVKVAEKKANNAPVGLGAIPTDATAISDLLFYNSGKNAYRQYVHSDSFGTLRRKQKDKQSEARNIGDAPLSISDKNDSSRLGADNFSYFPDIGNVPTLDVPMDLPDLPGIADNVHYVTETGTSIAPSMQNIFQNMHKESNHLQSIDFKSSTFLSEQDVIKNEMVNTPITTPTVINDIHEAEIPKSLENPVETLTVSIPTDSTDAITEKMETTPNLTISVAEIRETVVPLQQKKYVSTDDPHNSLMEAIRKAGGAKNLKSPTLETHVKESTPSTSSGDLMTDLHAKLLMRRKGISGNKAMGTGDSVMNKISNMIPPPVNIKDQSDSITEDEDWDD